jgi:hypothetical protein
MIKILKELEKLNESFRTILVANDFIEQFETLNENDREKFIRALSISVNNAKILTNKLINND